MKIADRRDYLLSLEPAEMRATLERMSDEQRRSLRTHWQLWAHPGQLDPAGEWHGWLIMAGRGFGKTRAGAEWVRSIAENDPAARIALVAASLGEARSVMVEGESGLLAISPWGKRPKFEPSRRLLTWPSGAQATLYSAAEPEALRGPQHSHACRPIPKGRLRQRIRCPHGCPAALRHRRRGCCAACRSSRGHQLAGRSCCNRCLVWPGWQDCSVAKRQLAVFCAA